MAVHCEECGRPLDDTGWGWRAIRTDLPDDEDPQPELAFFCPQCGEREFGDGDD